MAILNVPIETALERKFPEWIFFVITADPSGRANIMPAGWGMVCSYQPPMFAVAVRATNYSAELIEQTGEFVAAFLAPRHARFVEPAGTQSGRDVDKFAALGLKRAPAKEVRVPLLADSPLQLECKVASATPCGDHIIFAAYVLAGHVSDEPEPKIENFRRLYVPAAPVHPGEQQA